MDCGPIFILHVLNIIIDSNQKVYIDLLNAIIIATYKISMHIMPSGNIFRVAYTILSQGETAVQFYNLKVSSLSKCFVSKTWKHL